MVSQKIKRELLYNPYNLTSRYISKGSKITFLKRYLHSSVHCGLIHSRQDMETILSVFKWINGQIKCDCTHTYTHWNITQWNPVICDNMHKPGGHTLSEISQIQITKYCMISLYVKAKKVALIVTEWLLSKAGDGGKR